MAGILTVIYAPWDQYKDDAREWTRAGEIAFKTLAPQIMALCVGWITFACWKGYGGGWLYLQLRILVYAEDDIVFKEHI